MYAVVNTKNVFGISEAADFRACRDWLNEQGAEWQVFYPESLIADLLPKVLDIITITALAVEKPAMPEFKGPWLIFISDDTMAINFESRFC